MRLAKEGADEDGYISKDDSFSLVECALEKISKDKGDFAIIINGARKPCTCYGCPYFDHNTTHCRVTGTYKPTVQYGREPTFRLPSESRRCEKNVDITKGTFSDCPIVEVELRVKEIEKIIETDDSKINSTP